MYFTVFYSNSIVIAGAKFFFIFIIVKFLKINIYFLIFILVEFFNSCQMLCLKENHMYLLIKNYISLLRFLNVLLIISVTKMFCNYTG